MIYLRRTWMCFAKQLLLFFFFYMCNSLMPKMKMEIMCSYKQKLYESLKLTLPHSSVINYLQICTRVQSYEFLWTCSHKIILIKKKKIIMHSSELETHRHIYVCIYYTYLSYIYIFHNIGNIKKWLLTTNFFCINYVVTIYGVHIQYFLAQSDAKRK